MTLVTAMSFFFHQGRVSFTSYAAFNASMSELNTFDPAQIASRAPIDINPGAFSA